MKQLFSDLVNGLKSQGWGDWGGNDDTFLIMKKGQDTIKIFADNYDKPNHFIVRYSYNSAEEPNLRCGDYLKDLIEQGWFGGEGDDEEDVRQAINQTLHSIRKLIAKNKINGGDIRELFADIL